MPCHRTRARAITFLPKILWTVTFWHSLQFKNSLLHTCNRLTNIRIPVETDSVLKVCKMKTCRTCIIMIFHKCLLAFCRTLQHNLHFSAYITYWLCQFCLAASNTFFFKNDLKKHIWQQNIRFTLYIAQNNYTSYRRIPANSPGFPGSLQVFHEISRSPG